jgi:hypothetical protein
MYDISNYGTLWLVNETSTPPFSTFYQIQTPGVVTSLPLPVPTGVGLQGVGLETVQHDYQQPYIQSFNLSVEQQLPGSTVLSVAYAGSRGMHLWQVLQGNPRCPTRAPSVPFGCNGVTNTITTDGSYFWTSSGAQSPRQNNFWGASSVTSSTGVSWYNALQVNLKKQMTHGLQFQTAYTWSKALDTAQGQKFTDSVSRVGSGNSNVFAQNPFERGLEWAPAGFDAAHNLRFNMLYRLPGAELQGLVGKVLGGWWFGTIIAAQTGSPFHPTVAADRARAGVSGRNAVRPNYVTAENIATAQPGAVIYDPDTVITGDPNNWFNANMFTLAPLGTVGNVGRHFLR